MALFANALCALVTGATRGLGKVISFSLITQLKPGSTLMLLGRSQPALEAIKADLLKLNSAVSVLVYPEFECASLKTEQLANFISESSHLFSSINDTLLIHNAGTVGDPAQKSLDIDLQAATEFMNINFSSMVAANTIILSKLATMERKTIVNVSSLVALLPTKSLSLYCAGKAARDMFFRVFAAENPNIRVLSYAPGPLETDMFNMIKYTSHAEDVKTMFEGMKVVAMEDTVRKMFDILQEDKYESGDHIDYFDK